MYQLILSLILLTGIHYQAIAKNIERIRITHHPHSQLIIEFNQPTKIKSFMLDNPPRLVVDLLSVKPQAAIPLPDFNRTPIKGLRSGIRKNNTLRLVFDLKEQIRFNSQLLKEKPPHPHRLLIDLRPPNTSTTATHTIANDVNTSTVKTVTQFQQRPIIIAIDPGHGGKDPGAIGRKGTREKDIVLSISKKLAHLVNQEPGMRAYLTRNNDTFISLRERIRRARKQQANLFISIHADAFHKPQAKGASVFVLSERGASSEAAQMLADKENAADLVGGISLDDKDDDLASVLLDLSQTASLAASTEVAETVLSGLKKVGNTHKKRVESAAFLVLKSPDIPSILIETAFISNPEEEKKLRSQRHQTKLAKAIMSGIRHYFQQNPPPGYIPPQIHIVSAGDTLNIIAQRYQVSLNKLKKYNKLTNDIIKIGDKLHIP